MLVFNFKDINLYKNKIKIALIQENMWARDGEIGLI